MVRGSPQQRTVRIGWRHEVLVPDPGPPPPRPAPADRTRLSPEWVAAQRGSEARTNRPLLVVLCALGAAAALVLALWPLRVLPGLLVFAALLACLVVAVPVAVALLQSRAVVAERLARERERLEERRRAAEGDLRHRQEEHARRHRVWRARRRVFEAQPRWYALGPVGGARTVAVAGGTDAGWSALLTGLGASRLADGGALTVVDLSGRAVAGDLVALARRCGLRPRVRVLPADLPRLTLGTGLQAGERARTLAAVAAACDPKADAENDRRLLEGVLGVLGSGAGTDEVVAALRAVAAPDGDEARDDPALALLDPERRAAVRAACGADRATADRAWELERHLAPFEGVGSRAEEEPSAQVGVVATDRAAGEVAARAYGAYAVAGLCRLLERADAAAPWTGAVAVCGADAVPAAELDRLEEAAGRAGTGLVLLFPEAGDEAMARMGGPGRMPVVMRQPGTRPAARLVDWFGEVPEVRLHRLTEVIGEALSGTVADSYVGEGEDPAEAVTVPTAVRASASVAPLDLERHLRAASVWGRATAQADSVDGEGPPRTLKADVHGLRSLPPTAMLVPGEGGAVLADANPGILTLPAATLSTVEDGPPAEPPPDGDEPDGDEDEPPPNLGPPPDRLDWR